MRLALPWPLRGIVENVFPAAAGESGPLTPAFGGNPVLVLCGLYLLLSLGTGAFEWIQRVWMARVASGTAHDLRTMAVSRLGPSHDRSAAETADLITRVVGDVARIRADLKGILIHLGQNGLLLLAITALFLYLAPKLGLLFLVGGLLAILIGYQAVEPVARTAAKHRSKESAYAAAIQEEEDDEPESLAISESSTRKDVRTTRIIGRSTLLVHGAVAATISLALWIGVGDVRAGTLAPGELFLFIAYAITIQRRAVMIGRQIARGGKLLRETPERGHSPGRSAPQAFPDPDQASAPRSDRPDHRTRSARSRSRERGIRQVELAGRACRPSGGPTWRDLVGRRGCRRHTGDSAGLGGVRLG
jgi:ABC-type multidrug transport system fused ATPase/permease subunit